jgi:hypothetical protein
VIAALAIPTTAGARAQKAIWGPTQFSAGNAECGGGGPCSAWPVYSQLGVDVFEFRMLWSSVAPTRPANPTDPNDPAYRWPADFNSTEAEAAARGIQLAGLVEGAPSWANGGQGIAGAPNPADFANFMIAASRRYPSVHRWMVWGEPNRVDHLQPQGKKAGPRTYAAMLQAAYRALKSVDPSDVVVGGMLDNIGSVQPNVFIRNMRLRNGKRPKMDEFGQNPFDSRPPRLRNRPIDGFRGISDVDTLWQEVRRAFGHGRGSPKGLWLSEYTVQTDHPSFAFNFSVSPATQAQWLTLAYRLARRAHYVHGLGWYRLDDQPPGPQSANWGLETANGVRKPSFDAFAAAP